MNASRRCGWCSPSSRRTRRRAPATSWPSCGASARSAARPRRPSGRPGAPSRPTREAFEAAAIEDYLPAELSDDELDALVAAAVAETGASIAARHGPGDQAGDGGRRRSRRRQAGLDQGEGSAQLDGKKAAGGIQRGGGGARRVARRSVAHARGASGLRSLLERQHRHLGRRGRGGPGGRDGDPRALGAGRARARHRAGDDRVGRARARVLGVALEGARGRRVAPPQPARRPEVGQPEALRGRDPPLDGDVRHRPGRYRQDVPGDGDGHGGAVAARGQPDHPHAAGGRGGRAARLPAGRPDGEGRPLPAPAVRRA